MTIDESQILVFLKYLSSSFDSNTITFSNENEIGLDESIASDASDVSENLHSKQIIKQKAFTRTKRSRSQKSWVWDYFKKNKLEKKAYCLVKVQNENSIEVKCNHDYELSTGTGNLKSHLRQIHIILPPEKNNNKLTQIVSNQQSLHDFINKKVLLPSLKQNKITNRILAWIVDDLQPFYAIANESFRDMILECEPRFEFSCKDKLKEKLMQLVLYAEQQLKSLLETTMDSFCFTTDL
ncbi:17710_t:CDS:2 [Dentiscutata erythropus]|uniref:17710_t:CDS:1 n=1 Tax=Dentiscutata erythropus TaxID=1348616 RepID=A0A9N9EMF7_9GLOM|nr:17710_t:CDS:2 [Dentiscutata erythropus]